MPPKRAAPGSVPPEAPASGTPESNTELVDEEHARLTIAVRAQRQLAEIHNIRRELHGSLSPTRGRASAGTQPAPIGLSSARRAMAPPMFKGASLRELRDFQQGYKVFFDAVDKQDTRRRIITAALYLRDLPLQE